MYVSWHTLLIIAEIVPLCGTESKPVAEMAITLATALGSNPIPTNIGPKAGAMIPLAPEAVAVMAHMIFMASASVISGENGSPVGLP